MLIFDTPQFIGHPDRTWKSRPPTLMADLDHAIQFVSCRKFKKDADGIMPTFREELALACGKLGLGRVVWLHMGGLNARNWKAFVDHCAAEKLFIFDVWGYVPGQKTSGKEWYLQDFGEFTPTADDYAYLREKMGKRFLGYDIGEQDTRYLMIFAPQLSPFTLDRRTQYSRFFHFFERMRADLRRDTSVLVGGPLVHYLAKEDGTRLIGGESIQIHPNINLWHAFIRGAGRQYGVPWFGCVSVFNNFGYRDHTLKKDEFGLESGPESGPSDAMLRRAWFTLFAYNSAILGFEHFLFTETAGGGELTVLGHLQRELMAIAEKPANLKRLHTPVAIYLDFFQGWVPPRNAVNMEIHRVWGGLPYSAGDFQAAAIFDLLYPGYADSASFRDERGTLVNTPFGDIADVILSDCRPETLDAYNLVIAGGDLTLDAEQRYKLTRVMDGGGTVVCDSRWPGESRQVGTGRLVIVPVPNLLDGTPIPHDHLNRQEIPCPLAHKLHPLARAALEDELRRVAPLHISGDCMATFAFNDEEPGAQLLVANNSRSAGVIKIEIQHTLASGIEVLSADQAELAILDGAVTGNVQPGGMALANLKLNTPLKRREVRWMTALPFRIAAAIRGLQGDLVELLLRLPSFRNYFDGILLDTDAFLPFNDAELRRVGAFLKHRGIAVVACDLSPRINHYPDLTLIGGGTATVEETLAFLERAFTAGGLLGCREFILPAQKNGELAFDDAEAIRRLDAFFAHAAVLADTHGATLHFKPAPHRFHDSFAAAAAMLERLGLDKIGLWFDTSAFFAMRDGLSSIKHGYPKWSKTNLAPEVKNCFPKDYTYVEQERDGDDLAATLRRHAGRVAGVSLTAPFRDASGYALDAHLPVPGSAWEKAIRDAVPQLPGKTVVTDLDANLLNDWDCYFQQWQWLTACQLSSSEAGAPAKNFQALPDAAQAKRDTTP